MPQEKKKGTKDLEKVRETQRRSRARRREYLIDLEQKLRNYELQGIEASAEVQQAARRVDEQNRIVSEENRLLRAMLNRHGFSDDYILGHLRSGETTQTAPGQPLQFMPRAPISIPLTVPQTWGLQGQTSFGQRGQGRPMPPQAQHQAPIANPMVTRGVFPMHLLREQALKVLPRATN